MSKQITIELSDKEVAMLAQFANNHKAERREDATHNPLIHVMSEVISERPLADTPFTEDMVDSIPNTVLLYDIEIANEDDYIVTSVDADGLAALTEDYGDKIVDIKPMLKHATHESKAVFLTHAEARNYMDYQAHNLVNPYVYANDTGYANQGDLAVLYETLLKIGQSL